MRSAWEVVGSAGLADIEKARVSSYLASTDE